MTLRSRLVVLVSAAVALAIVSASVVAWLLIRSSLMAEVDNGLLEMVSNVERIALLTVESSEETSQRRFLGLLNRDAVSAQLLDADGAVLGEIVQDDDRLRTVLADEVVAPGDVELPYLETVSVDGESYRVMSAAAGRTEVLRLIRPLAEVEATLVRIGWLLAAVSAVGVALAGGLGWLTVRAGLRPVDGLVAAAEQVAATKDLAHRIDVDAGSRDEVARLAQSVNAMLAALDDARRQQRELIDNAGHELRTPLAVLRNDLGLLLRSEQHPERTLPAEDRERLLRALNVEAAALSELVGEVLDLARGELQAESPMRVDVVELVDQAVSRSRRVNLGVIVTVYGSTQMAVVQPSALERAVANLVRNAVQVSSRGGEVDVVVERTDGFVRVQVLDRGPGVAPDDMPHVFDRFYRGAAMRERPGSGLGLAIVAQVADQHGGSVEVADRDGGGAAFTLSIPAATDS